jgi:transaldolase
MIRSGALERLRDAGVTGVTANPTIFAKAIEASHVYADEVSKRLRAGQHPELVVWDLLIEDVQAAADIFRPVYERKRGDDGFVSIEVSPEIAYDTDRTIAAAHDLNRRVDRPNVMVKVPATPAGLPAIEALIGDGLNINVTLIFSVERYAKVVEAYFAGLERRLESGAEIRRIRSVASFFVSRIDTKVDEQLWQKIEQAESPAQRNELEGMLGRAAIANSKLAYEMFGQLHSGPRWEHLSEAGAAVQRPLWASTSTKNPRYPDTMYVDELIGPDTVDTMPLPTFEAFRDHGRVAPTLQANGKEARRYLDELAAVRIYLAEITQLLEDEGVDGFAKSFRESVERLGKVRVGR